jgi:cysteine desulfurase
MFRKISIDPEFPFRYNKSINLSEVSVMDNIATSEQRKLEFENTLLELMQEIPYSRLTGSRTHRLANHASFCFQFVEGETVLIMLDTEGICASSGSACTTGQTEPSHVLTAIGIPEEVAHGAIRFTLGRDTTKEQLDVTVDKMKEIVTRVRAMSPYYAKFLSRETKEANRV